MAVLILDSLNSRYYLWYPCLNIYGRQLEVQLSNSMLVPTWIQCTQSHSRNCGYQQCTKDADLSFYLFMLLYDASILNDLASNLDQQDPEPFSMTLSTSFVNCKSYRYKKGPSKGTLFRETQ